MMDFELKLEKPDVSRAWISAATMGLSYFIGMFIMNMAITHSLLMTTYIFGNGC